MDTPETTSAALASVVSEALSAAGISQRAAAEQSAIPLTTLSRRLTGRSPFTTSELFVLASLAGTTVSQLAAEAERRVHHIGGAA